MRALFGVLLIAAAASAAEPPAAPPAAPASEGATLKNAYRGVMQDRVVHTPDQATFVEKCGMCHRQMGMGTLLLARRMDAGLAMLEHRKDLTAPLIRTAVRQGIGNMPRLGRGEVSDAQLAQITAYLTSIR